MAKGTTVLHKEGKRGYTVSVVRRHDRPEVLWLRWFDPTRRDGKGSYAWESLPDNDLDAATQACKNLAAKLLVGARPSKDGSPAVLEVFALYEAGPLSRKRDEQAARDRYRLDLWQRYLDDGAHEVLTIDPDTVEGYTAWRRGQGVGDTTIGHEIVLLRGVLEWATRKRTNEGKLLLSVNPIADVKRIRAAEPNAPEMEPHHFLAMYRQADRVDAQGLLRPLLMLAHEHGWRLSAWTHLWASDLDPHPRTVRGVLWPYGRLRKRSENDKKKKPTRWIPMTPRAQRAAIRLLRRAGVVGNAYLFRSPRTDKPWSNWYALQLFHRAELAAGHAERLAHLWAVAPSVGDRVKVRIGRAHYPLLEYLRRHGDKLEGRREEAQKLVAAVNDAMGLDWRASIEPQPGLGYHALRRAWGSARKDLPLVDVAEAGDWHPATLYQHYQKSDPKTLLRVVSGGRSGGN